MAEQVRGGMRVLIVVLALALAGCTEAPAEDVAPASAPPEDDAANAPPAAQDTVTPANDTQAPRNMTTPTKPTMPGPAPAAPDAIVMRLTDISYDGRLSAAVCTFGDIRHECTPIPEQEGTTNPQPLSFPGEALRLTGTLTLVESPQKTPRVDAFLMYREAGESAWSYDFPNSPYASGPSPLALDWDLTPYVGKELAIFTFGSHAQAVGPVGVSYAPSQEFELEGFVASMVSVMSAMPPM